MSQTQVNLDIPIEIVRGFKSGDLAGHGIGPPLPIQRRGNTVETGIELVARIIAAYDIIQNTSGIFDSAAESCTPMSCLH